MGQFKHTVVTEESIGMYGHVEVAHHMDVTIRVGISVHFSRFVTKDRSFNHVTSANYVWRRLRLHGGEGWGNFGHGSKG